MQPSSLPAWRTMVAARATQTLAQGLASRLHQTLSPRGAAQRRGWRAVALACAAGDVAKASWLRRHDRFHLLPRLLLDSLDLTLWCMAAGDDPDSSEDAVIPGVALAAEAGARLGPGGLIVPASEAAVALAVRRLRGHRSRLGQFSWQLMGVVGGWALTRSSHTRRQRLDELHRRELAAKQDQAELAGLHDVLVAHEGALDLLQRATTLIDLGQAAPGRRRDLSGTIKAAVADTARGRWSYLADALLVWQAEHNRGPELAAVVTTDLAPGDGTLLLSRLQVDQLHRSLDQRDLRGRIKVAVVDRDDRRAFGPLRLLVDGDEVVLDGEPGTRWTLDALPTVFLLQLGWLTQPTGKHREAVPWSATAGPMAAAFACAAWSARRNRLASGTSPLVALAASFAMTMAYTLLSTATMRHPHTDSGVSRFPWVMPLQGYELVRGLTTDRLGRGGQALGWAGAGAIVAAGWIASPPPRSARALFAELAWVASFDLFARRIRQETTRIGQELTDAATREDATAVAAAYERGRARANAIVERALTAAQASLDEAAGRLDDDLRAEAARRLERVAELVASSPPAAA